MKLKLIITSVAALTILSGCGLLDKTTTSNATLQDKASYAIGAMPNDINISNVRAGLDKVVFHAEANDSLYRCYYTTAVAIKSDAVCTKMDGETTGTSSNEPQAAQCNALLKAAGRCE